MKVELSAEEIQEIRSWYNVAANESYTGTGAWYEPTYTPEEIRANMLFLAALLQKLGIDWNHMSGEKPKP